MEGERIKNAFPCIVSRFVIQYRPVLGEFPRKERSGKMRSYELTIETRQPTCGGKSPTKVELMEVELEDPMAFVRSREFDLPLETEQTPDGDLVVRVNQEKHQVTYTFTEL